MSATSHIVIPGQIIATSTAEEESFLRGHGTYLENIDENTQNIQSTDSSNIQTSQITQPDGQSNQKLHRACMPP